jgi:hypothetical protein
MYNGVKTMHKFVLITIGQLVATGTKYTYDPDYSNSALLRYGATKATTLYLMASVYDELEAEAQQVDITTLKKITIRYVMMARDGTWSAWECRAYEWKDGLVLVTIEDEHASKRIRIR